MPENDRSALEELITQMGPLPAVTDLSISGVMEAIGRDKKVVAGTLHFVLPRSIGTCEVVTDVTEDEILRSLGNLGLTSA
jgi:3-dehydroquinate synthetase